MEQSKKLELVKLDRIELVFKLDNGNGQESTLKIFSNELNKDFDIIERLTKIHSKNLKK